jgi:hypothetical protein
LEYPDFPALYSCCSKRIARAIVKDRFGIAGVELTDLQDTAYPQLVEVHWVGRSVDMITEGPIVTAGFSNGYPQGATHVETRRAAVQWHAEGQTGVVCRSASIAQFGSSKWIGDHADWSELAIYTQNSPLRPTVLYYGVTMTWNGCFLTGYKGRMIGFSRRKELDRITANL